MPRETAAVSAQVLCTPNNHAPVYSVTSFEATCVGCMLCLTVTCHPHFWRNDRDFLRATAVTRGRYGYRNKKHRKFDPGEENSLLAPQCRDSNPRPFSHETGALITEPFSPAARAYLPLHLYRVTPTLRAPLSGTFLQTLPDLVTPLKGHSLSPRSCPATRSAPSKVSKHGV